MYWLEQTASDVPDSDEWLSAAERLRLSTMRFPKRRVDWRLGRWTAKQAVAAYLGCSHSPLTLASIEVRASTSGAPEIFMQDRAAPLSLSISHCSGVGLCAIAGFGTDLGCDIEAVEPRSASFLEDYFTREEQRMVTAAPAGERTLLLNMLWSAKESALKALRIGLRLDMRAVAVEPLNDSGGEIWRALRAFHDGRVFSGWWREEAGMVRTIVTPARGSGDQVFSTPTTLSTRACMV